MPTQFLYLDESGDTGWTPEYGGNSNQYFVYAGVILDPDQNYELKGQLTDLLSDHFPGIMSVPEEIHYADAVFGNEEYDQLSSDERSDLRDDVFDLILDIEPVIMATVVDKKLMKDRYGDDAINPKKYAFRATIHRFHMHLEEIDSTGVLTIDSAERSYDRQLREIIYEAQRTGIKLPGASSRRETTLPRIHDTVTMTPSEMSSGIQLADVVAYQVANEYKFGDSHGYEALEHLLRNPASVSFTEPSEIPGK